MMGTKELTKMRILQTRMFLDVDPHQGHVANYASYSKPD